jgi:hypothetical protein
VKFYKGLLSAAMALTLTVSIPAVNASAFSVSNDTALSEISNKKGPYLADLESAADYLRAAIKNREKNIFFSLPAEFINDSDFYEIVELALLETDNSDEGDYLRKSIDEINCQRATDTQRCYYTYYVSYIVSAEQEKYITEQVDVILDELGVSGLSDYGKVCAIYEYIINNIEYRFDSVENDHFTAYGALKNGEAVCQGLTQLFYRLAKEAGLSCRMVFGLTTDAHAWNIVELDGLYYACDATYDIFCTRIDDCNYFLKGFQDFDEYDSEIIHVPGKPEEADPLNLDYTSKEFISQHRMAATAYKLSYGKGDVNGDGVVDSTDASLVMAEYARYSTAVPNAFSVGQKLAADVNDDETIDSSDASSILAYYSYVSTGGKSSIEDYLRR